MIGFGRKSITDQGTAMANWPTSLTIRIAGSDVQNARISVDELTYVLKKIQVCVTRVGQVLSGESSGARPGPIRRGIEEACTLEITSFSGGSVTIGIDVMSSRHLQLPMFDHQVPLGPRAVEVLIDGIARLEDENPQVVNEFDYGVLTAIRDVTQVFKRGVDDIQLSISSPKPAHRSAHLTPAVRDRVLENIVGPLVSAAVVRGRLREVNLERRSCQIFPEVGYIVNCVFDEQHEGAVKDALDQLVSVKGEALVREATGRISTLRLHDLEISDEAEAIIESSSPVAGSGAELLGALKEAGVVGMWEDRTDIEDSAEFARTLREATESRDPNPS